MSTRVRVEVSINNVHYAGWKAQHQLESLANSYKISLVPTTGLPKWKQLVYIYNKVFTAGEYKKTLIVIREKRKLPASRSRYIEICRGLGLGKKITKVFKKKPAPPLTSADIVATLRRAATAERNSTYVAPRLNFRRPTPEGPQIGGGIPTREPFIGQPTLPNFYGQAGNARLIYPTFQFPEEPALTREIDEFPDYE